MRGVIDIGWKRSYQLPKKQLTPHEQLIKWYERYDCFAAYSMCANKLADICKLATENPDPKWTTRKRIRLLVSRCGNGTVYSYNTIVSFLHSHGWIEEAFIIFDLMKAEGIVPTLLSFHSVINCCIAKHDYPLAGSVINDIRKAGLSPNVVTYSTLFKGFVDNHQPLEAVRMYIEDMERDKINPQFIGAIVQAVQANDATAISNLCADAIHEQLTSEEEEETKNEALRKSFEEVMKAQQ